MSVREKVERGLLPKEYLVEPDRMVRLLSSPDIVSIVVCGDPGRNRVMGFDAAYVQPSIREINPIVA